MLQEQHLTPRQKRELEYHREHAAKRSDVLDVPVEQDVISVGTRKWWNAFWAMYDLVLAANVAGKHVLVPGCGFGEDAIRLSLLGAKVSAFDLSAESIDIAVERAAKAGQGHIEFGVMPSEAMTYADHSFDLVLFVDILHHVDIARTTPEIARVLKPGGTIIGDELYTSSRIQRIRESRLVEKIFYPPMRRWIYGTQTPYITADEHKIDEHDFAHVRKILASCDTDYFGVLEGRLFPGRIAWASKLDRLLMKLLGPAGALFGSRIVFSGRTPGPARDGCQSPSRSA